LKTQPSKLKIENFPAPLPLRVFVVKLIWLIENSTFKTKNCQQRFADAGAAKLEHEPHRRQEYAAIFNLG
jgi:hypothetical protein